MSDPRLEDLRLPFKCENCDDDRHWREHWKEPTQSELFPLFTDADLLGELVRRDIYPLDFMRWLGQHPVGPDGTAYFVGTGREPVGSVGEPS